MKKLRSFNNFDKETTVKALRRFSKAVEKVDTPCEGAVEVYLETPRNCDDYLIYFPIIAGLAKELKADEIQYERDSSKLTFRWD